MGRHSADEGDPIVLGSLLAKEREVESHLLAARGEAEAEVERALERARKIEEDARGRWQARVDAAQRELAGSAQAAASRRLEALDRQIQHLKTLSDDQKRRGVRQILTEIFPELANPGR